MDLHENKNEMKEKIAKLHENLVNDIKAFKDDIKGYLGILDVYRRNNYSMNNNLYIDDQLKERNKFLGGDFYKGQYMTTFNGWKKLGYTVNKGEQAIKLIFPRSVEYFINENNKFQLLKYANKEEKQKIASGELESGKFNTYFSKGAIFDVRQTNCPKEEIDKVMDKLRPKSLQATDNEKMDMLMEDLKKYLTEKEGFSIKTKEILTGEKAYITENKEIVLNKLNSNTHNFKSLLHELGHWKAEHFKRNDLSNEMREIEAESIAYIVCKNHGIDTSDYSFKYLHGYGKNHVAEDIIKSQEIIKSVSSDINETLDRLYELRLEKSNIEHDLDEKYGELKVKILKSNNEVFKEGNILTLKELNSLIKENSHDSNLKLGILNEQEKKVLGFELKSNIDKKNLYEYINSSEKLKSALDNQIKNVKPAQTTEITTTKTIKTTTPNISIEM